MYRKSEDTGKSSKSLPFPPNRETKQKPASPFVQSQNNFARDLYIQLAKESGGNLFFSPFSIMAALGMSLAGARGKTKSEMLQVLHLENDDAIHDAFSDIVADIKIKVPEYELKTANMVYISNHLKIMDEFKNLLLTKYQSSAEIVDFNQEDLVRKKINSTVENVTNSRIKDLIGQGVLDPLTQMVLVNAVYFKGLWEHKFKKEETREEDFWTSATTSIKVPMMHTKGKFKLGDSQVLGARLLRMDYKGSKLSMVIVLPNDRDGLPALEEKLATAIFNDLSEYSYWGDVIVSFPKFKLEESFDLENHLERMGMVDLFSKGNADLSGISGSKGLYVSKVIHKAFIDVNEEGTEAAAATGMRIIRFSRRPPPAKFVADHPFIFLIQDIHSKLTYFVGRVVNL